jgi:hypothetical protein
MGLIQQQAAKVIAQPKISRDSANKAVKGVEDKWEANHPPDPDTDPTQIPGTENTILEPGERLSGDADYEKLPEKLREKLDPELWRGLKSSQQRWTLVETFSRMSKYGFWKQVKRVVGEKEQPEKHASVGGLEFQVAGNSGGIIYESSGGLLSTLLGSPNFGVDGSLIGSEHKGQTSVREGGPGFTTSLHIAVGPGNLFDAHIDKVSPTKKPEDGKTVIDPAAGVKHQQEELLPEKIRKKIKIPGVKIRTPVKENRDTPHGELDIGFDIELRGPVKKTKPPKPQPAAPSDDIIKTIVQRANRTKNYFPVPVGAIPDNVPVPQELASELASKMLEAARKHNTRVVVDLNYYHDHKEDQKRALDMMEELGRIVHSALGDQAGTVTALTVTFGAPGQGGTVSIAD